MPTTYSIPNRPSGASTRSISQILTNFDSVLAGMNSFDGGNLQAGTVLAAALADKAKLGLSESGVVRRGKSIIATEETRSVSAFGLLTTPDRVSSVVLPTDGLIVVLYQAQFKNTVGGSGGAAIFIGGNQLKVVPAAGGAPTVQSAATGSANEITPLNTSSVGLSTTDVSSDVGDPVTTGQVVGFWVAGTGGPCYIFAAAGTYDVSVQFQATSGVTSVKNRKLWVWTMGF